MFKRSKERGGMFQLPLPLSFTTVGMLFNMHMHTRRSVYEYVFDFMAKYVYAPYRRFYAMFSGRLDIKPGEDRSYFIDRNGTHLHPESTHKL